MASQQANPATAPGGKASNPGPTSTTPAETKNNQPAQNNQTEPQSASNGQNVKEGENKNVNEGGNQNVTEGGNQNPNEGGEQNATETKEESSWFDTCTCGFFKSKPESKGAGNPKNPPTASEAAATNNGNTPSASSS